MNWVFCIFCFFVFLLGSAGKAYKKQRTNSVEKISGHLASTAFGPAAQQMSDTISFFPNKTQNAEVPVVLVVQLASRHSCIADRLPNQDRRLATGSDKKSHKNAADASRPARRNDWLQPIVTNANLFFPCCGRYRSEARAS